jgi:hypothetical protein
MNKFNEFLQYNKENVGKFSVATAVIYILSFLVTYNYFRMRSELSLEASWPKGLWVAAIATVIIVIGVDVILFFVSAHERR